MDLTFTPEQELLRSTVREMLERHSTPGMVRSLEDDPIGYRPELWEQLATLDLTGLAIPEPYGGAGQGALEIVVLYEELGRALCPSPHFTTAVIAAGVLSACGTEEQRSEWLPRIVRGEAVIGSAWLEPERGCGPEGVRMRAERSGDSYALTGAKMLVPFASSATRLLTLARTGRAPRGVDAFLVDPGTPGISLAQMKTIGSDAAYLVAFDGAPVPSSARLGLEEGAGWPAWEETSIDGMIALAAQAIGGAERAHEMAVAYAKERVQFGRPIGGFQGVAHPLADTATEIAGGKVLVWEAAWARATGRRAGILAAMAKMYACDVFRRTTKVGQQILGGIGFTRDIDMQLYFRRAKQLEVTWWDPRFLEDRIAAAELDADTPSVSIAAGA